MYYVCDKKDNKYGVADTNDGICEFYSENELREISKRVEISGVLKDRIEVYTPEFMRAKAKLLGINIVNYDYLREGREYRVFSQAGTSSVLSFKDTKSGSIITLPYYKKHMDLINKLKIVNLFNNPDYKYSSNDMQMIKYNGDIVNFNYIVPNIKLRIHDKFGLLGSMQYFCRPSASKLLFNYFTLDNNQVIFELSLVTDNITISKTSKKEFKDMCYSCLVVDKSEF